MFGKIMKNFIIIGLLISFYGLSQSIQAQTCAPAPVGLVSWWSAEGNVLDSRGHNNGTLTGTTFVSGKVGQAIRLAAPATTDNFSADGSGGLDISGNQVTIEAWIKLENNSFHPASTFTSFIGKAGFPNNQTYLITFEGGALANGTTLPANQWQFEYILTDSSGVRNHNQRTNVIVTADGSYHHFALTYNGADSPDSNVKLYVDGILQTTNIPGNNQITGNLKSSPAEPFAISAGGGGNPFSTDEVSVYNRTLSAQEIQSIFSAGATGKCRPTATTAPDGLVGWWSGDGNANDISGNGLNGTLGTTGFALGKVGQGFTFNNSNGVSVADNAALNQQNFTLEAWVTAQPYSCAGCGQFIAAKSGNSFLGYEFGMNRQELTGFGGGLRFTLQGVTGGDLLSSMSIADGNFHHAAATYDGSTMKIYTDGVLTAQKSVTSSITYEANSQFVIGERQNTGATLPYNGSIDEVSLYNRALTQAEITSIFNAGLAGKLKSVNTPIGLADLGFGIWDLGLKKADSKPVFQSPQSVNVTVGDATITFPSVTAAGTTQEIPLDTSLFPALPTGTFTGLAYDIATSATFTGNPTVCFNLNSFTPAQFSNLRVFHFEAGTWVNRTAAGNSFPNLCTAGLASLSPLAIVQVAPTASAVTVSGVVSDADRFPLPQALISMTDSTGVTHTVRTNSFGIYRFDNVHVGDTYVFSIKAKGHQFQTQLVSVADEITNLNFTALP